MRLPLHAAMAQGHLLAVKLLVSTPGVDVNKEHGESCQTALMVAAGYGHSAIVVTLLNAPDIDIHRTLHYSDGPLGETETVMDALAFATSLDPRLFSPPLPGDAYTRAGKEQSAAMLQAAVDARPRPAPRPAAQGTRIVRFPVAL